MPGITNFREIRCDGKIIPESMNVETMLSLGWGTQKIAAVVWESDGKTVELKAKHGVLSRVLPGRDGVAVLEDLDERGFLSSLSVVNADGTRRLSVPNIQRINGHDERGQFRWFETARVRLSTCFGVVFELDRDHSQFQLDLDATTGGAVGVYPLR